MDRQSGWQDLLAVAAERQYREAIRRSPRTALYHEQLGSFLHDQGRTEAALAAWRPLAELPEESSASWRRLAEVYAQHGYREQALKAAEQSLKRESKVTETLELLVGLLLDAEEFERAATRAEALLDLAKSSATRNQARDLYVSALLGLGRPHPRIEMLETAYGENLATIEELRLLTALLTREAKHAEAADVCRAALEKTPDKGELLRELGGILRRADKTADAVVVYRRLLASKPRQRRADYENLLALALAEDNLTEARNVSEQLAAWLPADPVSQRWRAVVAIRAGDSEAGFAAYRHAVELEPTDAALRAEFAHQLARNHQLDEAREQYWRCFELATIDADRKHLVGVLAKLGGAADDVEDLVGSLRAYGRRERNNRMATLLIVHFHEVRGDYSRAREELGTLVTTPPRPVDLPILKRMVTLSESAHQWKIAVRRQQTVADLTDASSDLKKLLLLQQKVDDDEAAERTWKKLLAQVTRPDGSKSWAPVHQAIDELLREPNYRHAGKLTSWALDVRPDSWQLQYRLGWAQLALGDYRAAEQTFDRLLRLPKIAATAKSPAPGRIDNGRLTGSGQEERTVAVRYRSVIERIANLSKMRSGNASWVARRRKTAGQSYQPPLDPNTARIRSVLASYASATHANRSRQWLGQRLPTTGVTSPRPREVVLALAATGQVFRERDTMQKLIASFPKLAEPHLVRFTVSGGRASLARASRAERILLANDLRASFAWIARNRPAWRRYFSLILGQKLVALDDRETAVGAFVEALSDDVASRRRAAARGLRDVGVSSRPTVTARIEPDGVVEALIKALSDPSAAVVHAASQALAQCGPPAKSAIDPLVEVLRHDDQAARTAAAYALADLTPHSTPAVSQALDAPQPRVRQGALLALQDSGAAPPLVIEKIIRLVEDDDLEVRRQAVKTLGALGPVARQSVPALIAALEHDDVEWLRMVTAAVGDIGPVARAAVPRLSALLDHSDGSVRILASRALRRVDAEAAKRLLGDRYDPVRSARESIAELQVRPGDWPQWGGWSGRNNTPQAAGLPVRWDVRSGYNVKWSVPIGSQTYGNPSVANGRVFIGSNNGHGYLRRFPSTTDLGTVLCFDERDGNFLWQLSRPKLASGRINDWPEQGIPSTPLASGDRLWVVTNRGEIMCLDAEGFRDGENDGPFRREDNENLDEADVVWVYDMMDQLGVLQHNMANCSMTCAGDLLFVCTSNGVDEAHLKVPSPRSPAFLALDRRTGKLLWEDNSPFDMILHGQWSSPAYGVLGGVPQVVFAGGDGWLYSFDPRGEDGKSKLLWKFDCNPKDSKWELGGRGTRNSIIGFPCIYDDRVYVAVGQDPEHGDGIGHLWCIDPTRRGDVSPTLAVDAAGKLLERRRHQAVDSQRKERAVSNPNSALLWHFSQHDEDGNGDVDLEERFGRSLSTPAIVDDLLYVADLTGIVHCFDALTGDHLWTYDALAAIWGSALVADGKVYIGDEDGDVTVFRHGPELEVLHENLMKSSIYSTPIVANNVLYVTDRSRLVAIQKKQVQEKQSAVVEESQSESGE